MKRAVPLNCLGALGFRDSSPADTVKTANTLRGPNYRNVSGFADPKDFLLDLRQALIATFDRKITRGQS